MKAALALMLALPALAHHSWPVNMRKLVTVKGTITSVEWSNPHPMYGLEVRTPNGAVEKWAIGGPAITRPAPVLGQHSQDLLAEFGYGRVEIDALITSGVVVQA